MGRKAPLRGSCTGDECSIVHTFLLISVNQATVIAVFVSLTWVLSRFCWRFFFSLFLSKKEKEMSSKVRSLPSPSARTVGLCGQKIPMHR